MKIEIDSEENYWKVLIKKNQEQIGLSAPYKAKTNIEKDFFKKIITIFTEGNKVRKNQVLRKFYFVFKNTTDGLLQRCTRKWKNNS